MTKKKRNMICVTSLVVGMVTFSAAAFASYVTQNGYSVLKKSLLNTIESTNYTVETEFNVSYDGKVIDAVNETEKYSEKDNKLSTVRKSNGEVRCNYISDTEEITVYGNEVYLYDSPAVNRDDMAKINSTFGAILDRNSANDDKVVRFLELLADTLVGDLKNNFVFVSSENGISSYELKLNAVQIPELFNAGVSALFSSNYDYAVSYNETSSLGNDVMNMYIGMGESPYLNNVTCLLDVDAENRIKSIVLSAELNGEDKDDNAHKTEISYSMDFSDYGTTIPDKPDLNNIKIVYRESENRKVIAMETTDEGEKAEIIEVE